MKKQVLSFVLVFVLALANSAFTRSLTSAASEDNEDVYQRNLKIYNLRSVDESALAYYKLPSSDARSDHPEVIALAKSITEGKTGDYEMIRAVHDWVASNIWYDYDYHVDKLYETEEHKANPTLFSLKIKRGSCGTYANLSVALLRAVGIPAKHVSGFFVDGGAHAWTEAYADSRWVIMDATSDSLNAYENGAYSPQLDCLDIFFDISLKELSETHEYNATPDFYLKNGVTVKVLTNGSGQIVLDDILDKTATEIIIPDGVTHMGFYTFEDCDNLTSLFIPASVTRITDYDLFYFSKDRLTFYGIVGSYAETFAKEHNIKFAAGMPPAPSLIASPTAGAVLVNGENVAFDAYNINGNNYFKLRDLAYILNGTEKQFEVGYDGTANAISLTSGQSYTVVGGEMEGKGDGAKNPAPTNSKILLNDTEVRFTAYNIDGNNYFKLRDIGAAFDFGVDWDGAQNTIVIDTSKGYTVE